MQLNDLKPAWKQLKMKHSMEPIESDCILSIIESPQKSKGMDLHKVALNVLLFSVIAIFCQGG